jgi:hypothetical protein
MSIIIFPRWGSINFQIRNHDFKGKDCNAYIRNWKKNEWHHLAFVWNLGNEPVKMNIYIDGKLASKPVKGINCEANAIIPFKTFSYTPQFGCMNTGIWHATAFFDELRFSKHPKSKEDFTSHPTISGKDRCFSFENNFFSNCAEIKASQGLMPK